MLDDEALLFQVVECVTRTQGRSARMNLEKDYEVLKASTASSRLDLTNLRSLVQALKETPRSDLGPQFSEQLSTLYVPTCAAIMKEDEYVQHT